MLSAGTPLALWNRVSRATLANPVGFLFLFRWITIALAAVLVFGKYSSESNLLHEPGLLVYAIGHLAAGTLFALRIFPRLDSSSSVGVVTRLSPELAVVSAADIVGSLAVVYYSGGWGSPFWHFAVTSIMVPAFLLGQAKSLATVTAFSAGYVLMVGAAGNGFDGATAVGQRSFFFGNITTAYLIAIVVAYIGALFRSLQEQRMRTRAALDETETLFRIAEAVVGSGTDTQTLTSSVAHATRSLENILNLAILVPDSESRLTVASSTVELEQLPLQLAATSFDNGKVERSKSKRGVNVAVPLVAGGASLGVMLAEIMDEPSNSSPSSQLVETIASQVAIGLHNAALAVQATDLAAQEERARISREIHDGIAQSIFILGLQLETSADLADQKREDLPERLRQLVALSKETLLEVRHYIFDLKPYLAGQKGVSEMLTNQVNEFSKVSGIEATLETLGDERTLSVAGATALYRLTQESLANVLKHAAASRVDVMLNYEPGQIRLTVTDDGQGFEPDLVARGYGLENMSKRTEELDGSVTIESVPGDGTTVTVTLPV
jgi:signal transduction histidine kinase